jgi:hypothetical protein
MKITFLTSAFVALLGFALVGAPITAQAQTNTPAAVAPANSTATKTTKKTKPTRYEGTLTALDASSITVTSTKKTLTLALATTTVVTKDGKPTTIADFAVGDKVTGSYVKDPATGAMTAHSLRTKTPKTAAPAAPAPATPAAQ